ncbi:hypothetical protein MRB53_001647 [Persea americana]|uniref:Uncharacterized protein n=1 Tax=Persea americana TaxID=3435 RepID=A0ACC2MSG6_PERAE|nr:hypothetical protein MRB53_001647 [Persea americana]
MEDIGREYLADLVSRSLLNCQGIAGYYTMHDLTHDLARSVLGTDFWKIGDEKSHGNNSEKARYMSDYISGESCNFEDFYCLKSLRTLSLFLSLSYTGNIPADLFINLRHIHTLHLFASSITELPESIGDLLQLRYLQLFSTDIEIGHGMNELKDLIHLRGYLCISELENVVDVEEAKEVHLKNKQKIDRLQLRWKCDSVESWQEGIEEEHGPELHKDTLQDLTSFLVLHSSMFYYCRAVFPS